MSGSNGGASARIARTLLIVTIAKLLVTGVTDSVAWADRSDRAPADGNTTFFLFDLDPSASYTVGKNASVLAAVNASRSGVVVYADAVTAGDRYEVYDGGGGTQPPSAPTGVVAEGGDVGCATVRWNAGPELDIDFYRVYCGSAPRSYVDSLDVFDGTATTLCGLADGDYYFSLRAHNTAGLLSAISLEVSASVSNGSTQPPPPPVAVEAIEGSTGCIEVTWIPSGSPDVVGYVVDYGTQSVEAGEATSYEHTLDAGNAASDTVCGLTGGTYYVAVRSKNFANMLSAYSREVSVDVVPTAVFITAFSARSIAVGVELSWVVYTDEVLRGYKVLRANGEESATTVLNDGRPLDPSSTCWIDESVEPATTYEYTLAVIGEDGVEHQSLARRVTTRAWSLSLEQNAPNPFNPSTSISFLLPQASHAVLAVYDVTGAPVRVLIDETLPAGRGTIRWNGINDDGKSVGSGTYFCRLTVGKQSVTRKMLLLK
jgi:hypothetical protein